METAIQIRICKKCGMYFVNSKPSKMEGDNQCCYNCSEHKFSNAAALIAKVIEKMMRE